jgi:hypothetical protein
MYPAAGHPVFKIARETFFPVFLIHTVSKLIGS